MRRDRGNSIALAIIVVMIIVIILIVLRLSGHLPISAIENALNQPVPNVQAPSWFP